MSDHDRREAKDELSRIAEQLIQGHKQRPHLWNKTENGPFSLSDDLDDVDDELKVAIRSLYEHGTDFPYFFAADLQEALLEDDYNMNSLCQRLDGISYEEGVVQRSKSALAKDIRCIQHHDTIAHMIELYESELGELKKARMLLNILSNTAE